MREKVREALVGRDDEMLAAVQGEGWRGVDALGKEVYAAIGDDELNARAVRNAVEDEIKVLVRRRILEDGRRPDDREIDQVRGLHSSVGLLPRAHGSGLFRRGGTQILSVATLGSLGDRPAPRHARAHAVQALHAPLQLPAVFRRRGALHARPRPPRDRPRPARRAGAGAGPARQR